MGWGGVIFKAYYHILLRVLLEYETNYLLNHLRVSNTKMGCDPKSKMAVNDNGDIEDPPVFNEVFICTCNTVKHRLEGPPRHAGFMAIDCAPP